MKVLVVGSGGREHALVWKLASDPEVKQIYGAPGNPGIAQLAQCVPANLANSNEILQLAEHLGVDLTVIGPEAPLVAGVVDTFRAANRLIIGPTQANARLEGSKVFAKQFFAEHAIPTAEFHTTYTLAGARKIAKQSRFPLVVKADGLAAGKGVVIAQTAAEAVDAIEKLGPNLVLEEFLTGEEVSFIVLSDGRDAVVLEPCQDHKAAYDGDRGSNTGGMGAYCDSRILTDVQRENILDTIIRPTIARTGFSGFLYAGLIMTADGPKLLEYNVRLGDPETQPIMHRMVADFGQVLFAAACGNLRTVKLDWRPEPSICVVLASQGYPNATHLGDAITGIAEAESSGTVVFQAGTKAGLNGLVTAGGRVMGVTARGPDLPAAIQTAYRGVSHINYAGAHFRKDIGQKGLSRWPAVPLQ